MVQLYENEPREPIVCFGDIYYENLEGHDDFLAIHKLHCCFCRRLEDSIVCKDEATTEVLE